MTIEDALTAFILAQTGLTALIGRRYFYDVLPMGTALPAVVCKCVSDVKIHTHQGQASSEEPSYDLTAYASTRSGARAVAEQIKAALCDYVGTMSGLAIEYCTLLNELPDTLTNADGTIKIHTVTLEFEIDYKKG